MKGPISVFACGVLLVLATGDTAAAKCVFTEPEYVATIVVRECADAVTFGLKRLGSPGFEWVATYVEAVLEEQPGVVITGQLTRRVYVKNASGVEPIVVDDVPGNDVAEWYVPTDADGACQSFLAGSEVRLLVPHVCCDVLPSYEPACVLEMDSLAALPRELRVLLEAE